jgi:pimeloyl-ACP methyl ester carboxylesterase
MPTLTLAPCHLERLAEQVLCGVHEVFEDRASGRGKRIPIHVAVLPPLRRSPEPDPLVILAGGPGQGARSFAAVAARYFTEVRRTRAIVLVDLRGTGASHPLTCLRGLDEMDTLGGGGNLFFGDASRCAAEIDADLRQYTHANALADLDEIRQRLGVGSINVWGGSWGTRAALLYALTYPEAVRSVVLDGAVSFDMAFPRPVANDAQRALDLLFDRCAATPACAATFPNPRRELDALLTRLERAPARVTLRHPRTAASTVVTLTRDAVAEIVRVALYTPQDAARVPRMVRHALQEDYGPLAAQYVHMASMSVDDMALGATMSILCSEDMPLVATVDFTQDSRGTFLGASYAAGWRSRCRNWPAGPSLVVDPQSTSAAPALILSGAHDPVTPPRWGDAMGRRFPRHAHIVVTGAAHNASFTGCMPDVIAAFLKRGSADALDVRCVASATLPPTVVNDAGGRP